MVNQQITFGGIKLMTLRWDRGPSPFRGRLEVIIGYELLRILFFPAQKGYLTFSIVMLSVQVDIRQSLTGSGFCNILCYSVAL